MLWTYFALIVNKRSQIYLGEKSNITNVKKKVVIIIIIIFKRFYIEQFKPIYKVLSHNKIKSLH